uniref:Uncharacterized protein n=1 Tax=Panagrolaimus sp. JU765 TaxID=591449 RepID=A0AC34R2E6_9BILA
MESPRSPSQLLRSPNPVRTKVADELYGQMTVQHTNTLAFVVDNYSDIVSNFNELSEYGRDLFEDLSIENLIFKSTTPILVKEKLAVFDAAYVTPNYTEHRVTVMLAPTCQYAPLMGRLAERSGFGPTILAEIEEPEITFRNLLEQAGIDFIQRSSIYKVMIMPPISLCSFHSLAVHNMHKAMNVQRYEHHVCFIMLQLLCALKVLQSDGVEHLSNNFKEFLLTYKAVDLKNALEDLQQLPKLMFLRETMEEDFDDRMSTHTTLSMDSPRVGVCRYALRALCTLLNHKMHNTVPDILDRTEFSRPLKKCAELLHLDKSSSLTEAKNLIEFTFFCGRTNFESEFDAKLWLDERRAHEVNRLVRLLADRSDCLSESRERMYIQFLLSATPRTIYNTFRQYIKL